MGPEILIVGDRTQRGSLLPRVQDLGYLVTPVRERELTARVEASPAPVAVLVCLGDEDPANLIDAVRSGRDDVPVILYGSLGGTLHDLADVLELGADHFLAEPVGDEELASVLAELAGPGGLEAEDGAGRENVLSITPTGAPGPIPAEGGDPVLGQLHRTLEMLAARLQTDEEGDHEGDGIDLEGLGLDAVPDVDAGAGHETELDPDRGRRENSDPAAQRRADSTMRLAPDSGGPRRAAPMRTPTGRAREPEAEPGATLRLTTPRPQAARGEGEAGRREGPSATQRLGRDEGVGARAGRDEAAGGQRTGRDETAGGQRTGRDDGPGAVQRMGRDDGPGLRGATRAGEGQRPGTTQRLVAQPVREARLAGAGREDRSLDAVREDRSAGREDRSGGAGREDRSLDAVREDRSAVREDRSAVREDRSAGREDRSTGREDRSGGAVREDRSAVREDRSSEATARVHVRRDVPAVSAARAVGERLAGVDVVMRLGRLHRQRSSGRLVVGFAGGAVKDVWWRAGEPVFATSTAAADGLLVRLQARGMVSRGEAAQVGARVDGDVTLAARRLVEAGLLKPREQADAVRDVVVSIVLSLCSDEAVRWSFDSGAAPPTAVNLGVPVTTLVVRGVRLGLGDERLRAGLAASVCLRVSSSDVRGLAAALDDEDAASWLGLLDGSRSLGEVVAEDGLDERSVWSAACVLVAMGLASEVDAGASLVAIDRRRVAERLALAHASDYFTLLGVSRSAGRAELLRAHVDLRSTFAPERLEPASRTALAVQLQELQAALDEARDVLLDEPLRTAYLARLEEEES